MRAFNHKHLYFSFCSDIEALLPNIVAFSNESKNLSDRFSSDFVESMIYSEIEGTSNVENAATTIKKVERVIERQRSC